MAATKIYISGHRNPDLDSLASAYALSVLRQKQADEAGEYVRYEAICPGLLTERAEYLFQRFGVKPPRERHDVFLRMQDLMQPAPTIPKGTSVAGALNAMRYRGVLQMPITNGVGEYIGMFNAVSLLKRLLALGNESSGEFAFSGNKIFSSLELICKVLRAKPHVLDCAAGTQVFEVVLAATTAGTFREFLPKNKDNLIAIVGDDLDLQRAALEHQVKLLILTGTRVPAPEILELAEANHISLITTQLDPAGTLAQLKFAMPVESTNLESDTLVFDPQDRVKDYRKQLLRSPAEFWPIVTASGILEGVVYKSQITEEPPFKMILVDHNEPTQFLPGVEELPIIEVIDHHRISMFSSEAPLKFTGDIVGSTCTIVTRMFRDSGIVPSKKVAGILLGGLVSDTLNLRSPTTSETDRELAQWLEELAGVPAEKLMSEIMEIASPLVKKSANEVISGDRKDYLNGGLKFALAQVEESHLELLDARKDEILAQMKFRVELEGLAFFGLLVTDAIHEVSHFLICGRPDFLRTIPFERISPNLYSMPGVLSRKKQLLPQILSLITTWQHS